MNKEARIIKLSKITLIIGVIMIFLSGCSIMTKQIKCAYIEKIDSNSSKVVIKANFKNNKIVDLNKTVDQKYGDVEVITLVENNIKGIVEKYNSFKGVKAKYSIKNSSYRLILKVNFKKIDTAFKSEYGIDYQTKEEYINYYENLEYVCK